MNIPYLLDTSTGHHLHGDADDITSAHRALWELLANIAWPIVKHYRGDLWHDAQWIRENITGDTAVSFAYGIRECGTSIGTDAALVAYGNDTAYAVDVGPWYSDGSSSPNGANYWRGWRARVTVYRVKPPRA